jgi:hypothetical protein
VLEPFLKEVTFTDLPCTWPPPSRASKPEGSEQPSRGCFGWGDFDLFHFYGSYVTPGPIREQFDAARRARWDPLSSDPCAGEPHQVLVGVADWGDTTRAGGLLVKTGSLCRPAPEEEVQQFVASDAAEDGDRFDVWLSYGRNGEKLCVFLQPSEFRLTGRPKAVSAFGRPLDTACTCTPATTVVAAATTSNSTSSAMATFDRLAACAQRLAEALTAGHSTPREAPH